MMRLVNLLAVICVSGTIAPIAAIAAPPPGDNVIGLYTTTDGACENVQYVGLAESFGFFVCVSGCTFEAGIAGYEFCVVQEGDGVVVMAHAYPGTEHLSVFDFNCPIAGLAEPLLPNEAGLIVIGQVTGLSFGGAATFSLRPIESDQSIAGEMAIADGAGPGNLAPAVPASGSPDIPCFYVNREPSDTLDATWSRVRRLYR